MMMGEKKGRAVHARRKSELTLLDFLEQEGLSPALLDGIREFRAQYPSYRLVDILHIELT